ncbi:MAG: hypothetical protein NTV30_04895 [Chloroflexi bacterium]|nr:hypothetical protein [Chloroflexota bacterium]
MRIDKKTGQKYDSFWDWLQIAEHTIWIINLLFAYAYYLMTTEQA